MKVLTFGDSGDTFLVCPLDYYSEEKELDPESPNYGYRKHYDKWVWMTLRELFVAKYTTISDKTGEIFCMLVASKEEERGVA